MHKLLKKIPREKGLLLEDKKIATSYEELLLQIRLIDDNKFKKILLKNKEHITNWLQENYEDEEIIKQLKKAKTKKEHEKIIENRIKQLKKEEQELKELLKHRDEIIKKKTNILPIIWVSIYAVLLVLLLFQHVYYTNQTTELNTILREEKKQNQNIYQDNQDLREQIITLQQETTQLKILKREFNEKNNELLEEVRRIRELTTKGPSARIQEEDISLVKQGVLINIKEPQFAKFEDTKSMIPTINKDSKAIQIKPQNTSDIKKGDIISYMQENKIIIHRVIATGTDYEGWYAITKGDNALRPDREKIRFNQIKRILVVIIY